MESQLVDVIDCLVSEEEVQEFYVLVREIKMWINFDASSQQRGRR